MRIFSSLLLALGAILAPIGAAASIITISFTGEIASLTNDGSDPVETIDGFIGVGDAVSGSLTYDTSLLGTSVSSATSVTYNQALSNFDLTIGTRSWNATGGNVIVDNDDMAGSSAPLRDNAIFQGLLGLTGPSLGSDPARLQFALGGTDTSVLGSTALVGVPELNALWAANTHGTNLNFLSLVNGDDARFNLTGFSVTTSDIPLPAGLPLLLAGLGAFGLLARRRSL